MLTDAQRIQRIKFLVDNGFSDKIVVGHDIHTKHTLVRKKMISLSPCIIVYLISSVPPPLQVKYGGHGYGHFLEHVAPKMIERGIPPETVHKFTVENPRQWLTFA